jgi:hypothetical protein
MLGQQSTTKTRPRKIFVCLRACVFAHMCTCVCACVFAVYYLTKCKNEYHSNEKEWCDKANAKQIDPIDIVRI